MKRFLKTACLVLVLSVSLSLGGVMRANAENCSGSNNVLTCACESGAGSSSAACSADSNKDPIAGPHGAIKKASVVLSILAGIGAVIMIIVSGFRYVLSSGDAQKAASARSGIIGSVTGLIVIAVAESIVIFVVSKI